MSKRSEQENGSVADSWPDARPFSRRQMHRRMNLRVPVRISTIDSARDPETGKAYFHTSEETCADVSSGGAFVLTPEALELGRRLLLEIELPNGASLQILARVVWRRIAPITPSASPGERPGIGVEFTGGNAEGLAQLERYIEKAGARRSKISEDATPRLLHP